MRDNAPLHIVGADRCESDPTCDGGSTDLGGAASLFGLVTKRVGDSVGERHRLTCCPCGRKGAGVSRPARAAARSLV
jgi:hypothetical protein